MTAPTARLWNGIACVGTLVLMACLLLALDVPGRVLPVAPSDTIVELLSLFAFFAVVAVVMLPFDLMGGLLIPAGFSDEPPQFLPWFRTWTRSVCVQLLIFSLTFLLYLHFGREVGSWSLILIFALIQLILLAGQELLWYTMTAGGGESVRGGGSLFVRSSDDRFAGGVTGVPGCETILMPLRWKDELSASDLHLLIRRRRLAVTTGGRLGGILLAMGWNFVCFTSAVLLAGPDVASVADMVTVYLWFLLFSFAGLLMLPVFNRLSVFALDQRLAMERSAEDLSRAIAAVDQLTERDPQRSVSAESVFQPVPCPDRRLQSLGRTEVWNVKTWNVARMALFLSWACGGPLARAVHCNVGRPELWALLPAD